MLNHTVTYRMNHTVTYRIDAADGSIEVTHLPNGSITLTTVDDDGRGSPVTVDADVSAGVVEALRPDTD